MGIDGRNYDVEEIDLVNWFRLIPDEEVAEIQVWWDNIDKSWNLYAIINKIEANPR